MDKEDLIKNIKGWIHLDEEIKDLQRQIKEKRNEKKQNTESLVKIMRENEIDCFDITDGKLLYTKNKVKSSLSKKHLLASLAMYFKDDKEKAKAATGFILESRQTKIKENIRLKMKKK